MSKTQFFDGNCGNIEGASAGELFPPQISEKRQTLSVFSNEMCRNVDMDFDEEVDVNGITGRKFIGGDRTVDKYGVKNMFLQILLNKITF